MLENTQPTLTQKRGWRQRGGKQSGPEATGAARTVAAASSVAVALLTEQQQQERKDKQKTWRGAAAEALMAKGNPTPHPQGHNHSSFRLHSKSEVILSGALHIAATSHYSVPRQGIHICHVNLHSMHCHEHADDPMSKQPHQQHFANQCIQSQTH